MVWQEVTGPKAWAPRERPGCHNREQVVNHQLHQLVAAWVSGRGDTRERDDFYEGPVCVANELLSG